MLTQAETIGELAGGQPLQPQVKLHLILLLLTKLLHRSAAALLILFRPGRPAPQAAVNGCQMGMQRIKGRLLIQAVTTVENKLLKCLTLLVTSFARLELRERQRQRRQLKLRHRAVIHQFAAARGGQFLLRGRFQPPSLRGLVALEIFHRVHIDINHVQPAAR
ncbi:hypothetical protein D3C80_1348620 [compost metagenome]